MKKLRFIVQVPIYLLMFLLAIPTFLIVGPIWVIYWMLFVAIEMTNSVRVGESRD